jgi:4-amino-4-deoxy-L-arabinose transferase-like glycosyltransferase
MASLQSLDIALFRFVNLDLRNRFLDWLLPYFSSNSCFIPALALLAIAIVWKGSTRARLMAFFLLLTFLVGDPVIVKSLKHWFSRPRPFLAMADVHVLVGEVDSGSMPSGHAANWFAAATVAGFFYRWSLWFMLPMALIEAFSRVYLGVHYPSDVLAGATLGVSYVALTLWAAESLWRTAGKRFFPLWWAGLPSLLFPEARANSYGVSEMESTKVTRDEHWLRLACLLIGGVLAAHLVYLASHKIELSEDEAYQWLWSKHLALSYYSKPPLIACTQFLGTHLFGDTEFGVRFFSPVLGALTSLLLVRFLAREANGRVACLSVLVATATPLLMVGATLITIDCLSVLFWVAAMLAGWRAVRRDSTRDWLWAGLWMGLGFLSKYTALIQLVSWAVFFLLWPAARPQLRRRGPCLALLVNAVCLLPVVVWNAQHHWITLSHLADRGGLDQAWHPTLRFVWDFLFSEALILNPIFFVAMLWAGMVFWKRFRSDARLVYLFSMGAPLFLFYSLYTLRSRVQPNWIAPSVLPLFCLMLIYFESKWRQDSVSSAKLLEPVLVIALVLGWMIVVPLHDTRLIYKATGHAISWKLDPLTRVLGYRGTAEAVSQARAELLKEGKPVFVIGGHYGITSLLSFYMPEARQAGPDRPLVYCQSSDHPANQFFFWPGYRMRRGDNAIYVAQVDRPESTVPPNVRAEFASVTDLGFRDIFYRGVFYHRIHLFACRDLR